MNVFEDISGFIVNTWGSMKSLMSMTKLEVRLARLSLYPVIITICLLLVILMTIWITAMSMVGYAVLLVCNKVLIVMAGILLFNLCLFKLLKSLLSYHLRNMSFAKTRQYFSWLAAQKGQHEHEQTQNGDDGTASSGTNIATTNAEGNGS